MKRISCYIAIILLPVLSSFAADWVKFTPTDGAFSISFPSDPKENEQKLETDIGPLLVKMYTAASTDNDAYMLMTTDYPASSNVHSDADEAFLAKLFRGGIDGAMQNLGDASLLSENNIKLDGYPGREFKISFMSGEGLVHGRIYLVRNRMYMVQIVGSKENAEKWEADRYLTSFKLKGK